MRRALFVAAMLCLMATGCNDKEAVTAGANAAVDAAASSTIPWLQLGGLVGTAVLSALGLRRANRAVEFTDGVWDREETAELVKALREHGYKIDGPA